MNDPAPIKPTWRKPAGVLFLLAYICAWTALVVSQWEWIGSLPILIQMVIYLIAGVIWLYPLKPLLIWMETGKFTAD